MTAPAPTAQAARAVAWLAEAVETGNALAPLPPEAVPASAAEAEDLAFAVLDACGFTPCGLRVVPGPSGAPVAGPMIETRLLPSGAEVPAVVLRHGVARPALLGVLAEALEPDDQRPPVLRAVHPALDLAAFRWRDPPADDRLAIADLAGLGLVVMGKGRPAWPATVAPAMGTGRGLRTSAVDIAGSFAEAAAMARGLGGLPAGALLIRAFGAGIAIRPGPLLARLPGLGTARATVAGAVAA